MKIGIIGANGKVGSAVMAEALMHGHEVTAIVRTRQKQLQVAQLVKPLLELTYEDIQELDVVVNAVGAWTPETFDLHIKGAQHLARLTTETRIRLMVVGGAGSLYTDATHQMQLKDTAEFPAAYYPLADAMSQGLAVLRTYSQVLWTYFSPAAEFDPQGERTGHYIIGGEEYIANESGQSYISYQDYAAILVQELEQGNYIRQRFTAIQA